MTQFWLDSRLRTVTLHDTGLLAPTSPRPYKGFTSDSADLIYQFQDAANKQAMPSVHHVAGHAKAGYPQVLH